MFSRLFKTVLHPDTHQICFPVFLPAAGLVLLFVAYCSLFQASANELFAWLQSAVVSRFGWFYLASVAVFVIFCLALIVTRYGDIKLGQDHAQPEYSFLGWFSMLFSAGMGIGLIFYGVAEPLLHYIAPPVGSGNNVAAAKQAMVITFFHWGFSAWAVYGVVGLSLAFFAYRFQLPLTVRSTLYPLIGDRIYGPIGHAVDVFAVLGTLFGVATSMGFGVLQINAGLHYLLGIEQDIWVQCVLIAIVTVIATLSVVMGLDSGIKRLSQINVYLAVALMLFVLFTGATVTLLDDFVQNIGAYLNGFVGRTFNLYAYQETHGWLPQWKLFYWGWWISWSPFVGVFIARISKGRTIREFIAGVLFVPAFFTFLWMSVFGNSAMNIEMQSPGALSDIIQSNLPLSLYYFLQYFPWPTFTSILATVLIVTFFVTSADSGSLVMDTITSGGVDHPHTWQRVFWAVIEGVVAAVLLVAGGMQALQTATIVSAFPFLIVMLLMVYSLMKGLNQEGVRMDAASLPPTPALANTQLSWQDRLHAIMAFPVRKDAQTFLLDSVLPALRAIVRELKDNGIDAALKRSPYEISMCADYGDEDDFYYAVRLVGYDASDIQLTGTDDNDVVEYFRAEVHLAMGGQDYDILGYTHEQVINDVLEQYDRHMHYLHGLR